MDICEQLFVYDEEEIIFGAQAYDKACELARGYMCDCDCLNCEWVHEAFARCRKATLKDLGVFKR